MRGIDGIDDPLEDYWCPTIVSPEIYMKSATNGMPPTPSKNYKNYGSLVQVQEKSLSIVNKTKVNESHGDSQMPKEQEDMLMRKEIFKRRSNTKVDNIFSSHFKVLIQLSFGL